MNGAVTCAVYSLCAGLWCRINWDMGCKFGVRDMGDRVEDRIDYGLGIILSVKACTLLNLALRVNTRYVFNFATL